MNNPKINTECTDSAKTAILFPLETYPEIELRDNTVVLLCVVTMNYKISRGTDMIFSLLF